MIAHQNRYFAVLSLWRTWGFSIVDGSYHGWKWCAHVGPFLILFGDATHKEG